MTLIAQNKRTRFDYEILETFEAGIELKGFEVKSVLNGRVSFAGAYGLIRNNQVWIVNMEIPPYQPKNTPADYDSKRTRRLLLKRSEINFLTGKLNEKNLTLVPLRLYTKNNKIKAELGLARRRRKKDKRELIKKQEFEKEIKTRLRGA